MPPASRVATDETPVLGWEGFQIPLPEEWALAAFSGDWDAGYLRAEGPGDAALELKWKRDKTSPSLKGVLKSYVKQLNKAGGRGADVEVKEKPKALPSVPQGSGVSQTFAWKSHTCGVGAVWHCLECRRIVIVQITCPQQAVADNLARRILPKIVDHPAGGVCRWSVYGFTFEAPERFRLEKQGLRSGHLSFELKDKRQALVVERYGPATVLLKRDKLADWATAVKTNFTRLKPFRYRKTAGADGPHTLVRVKGRKQHPRYLLLRGLLWLIRRQAADAVDARVWNCDASNRIYMVMAEGTPRDAEALAEEVAATIPCHAPDAPLPPSTD